MELLIQPKHRIRDPIYGYIWLTDSELKIIDTPVFQRLRRISQLALTRYVYPSAEHSRFVHSLGVLQAATNIFYEVLRFNPQLKEDSNLKRNLQILRYAALLHDIGHMPFSHAAEKFYLEDVDNHQDEQVTHEDIGKYIIEHFGTISEEIEKNSISTVQVASLLKGKCTQQLAVLKKFISDEFDADRADYLLRDSYFCGVKYGEYDYIRYAGSFRLVEREDGQRVFAIERGNLHAVESFLLARYHYYLQVPFHRTRKGYDMVLNRYFLDLKERNMLPDSGVRIKDGAFEVDFDLFQLLDDYTIFERIKEDSAKGNTWAKILMRQDRIHPIFDTEKDSESNKINFLDLQNDLIEAGLKKDQDYFVFEKRIEVHKKLEKSDETGEGEYPVVDKALDNRFVGNVLEHSSLLSSTQDNPVHIRRIYVTSAAKTNAEKVYRVHDERLKSREKMEKGGRL